MKKRSSLSFIIFIGTSPYCVGFDVSKLFMISLMHSGLISSKDKLLVVSMFSCITFILGDSRKYVPPILATSSAKRIATQILVIAKLNEGLLN